jgi:hypothetical protein
MLTHLWPGTSREASLEAARTAFSGEITVGAGGLVVDLA